MANDDMPAMIEESLEAPEPSAEAPAKAPEISAADALSAQSGVDSAFAKIREQPTVRIRVPKVHGPQVVVINGARFNIPSNVSIDVPQQVADVLAEAGRI